MVGRFDFEGDGMDIPYNTLACGKEAEKGKRELKV